MVCSLERLDSVEVLVVVRLSLMFPVVVTSLPSSSIEWLQIGDLAADRERKHSCDGESVLHSIKLTLNYYN